MAGTFAADVRQWSAKAKQNAEFVIRGSVQDVGELMTRRAAGTTDGGSLQQGYVPVVTGELINSQEVGINGGVIATGDVDYSAAVAGMDLGDSIQAVFTAGHARPKEYGFTTSTGKSVPGWFFVRGAVQQWATVVEMNAAQFRD